MENRFIKIIRLNLILHFSLYLIQENIIIIKALTHPLLTNFILVPPTQPLLTHALTPNYHHQGSCELVALRLTEFDQFRYKLDEAILENVSNTAPPYISRQPSPLVVPPSPARYNYQVFVLSILNFFEKYTVLIRPLG
jgi:hypothetical protein